MQHIHKQCFSTYRRSTNKNRNKKTGSKQQQEDQPQRPPPTKLAPNQMRITLAISHSGFCSRRDAERLVREGSVKLDGEVMQNPTKILDLTKEFKIEINGSPIHAPNVIRGGSNTSSPSLSSIDAEATTNSKQSVNHVITSSSLKKKNPPRLWRYNKPVGTLVSETRDTFV